MKHKLLILVIFILSESCTLRYFSTGDRLRKALESGDSSAFEKDSRAVALSYKDSSSYNTSGSGQFRKFDRGIYIIKMVDEEVSLPREIERIQTDASLKAQLSASEQDKLMKIEKDTTLTIKSNEELKKDSLKIEQAPKIIKYKVSNSTDPSFSDKMIYLVFLDHERVLFHSPYRQNFVRTGDAGKVLFKNDKIPHLKKNGKIKRQKKYLAKTKGFFKLGIINCDYNSTMRGYYKLKDESLSMWLEKGGKRKQKTIRLIRLDFRFKASETTRMVTNIHFTGAMHHNVVVNVDDTFYKDKEEDKEFTFRYWNKPVRLILVRKDPEHPNLLETLIIKQIEPGNGTKKYQVLKPENNNNHYIVETPANVFTF